MVRFCVVVWILSWSFQSYVLRRLVIAPKELICIWYGSYCRPHLLVFYAMLLFRSPHFKRAVVCSPLNRNPSRWSKTIISDLFLFGDQVAEIMEGNTLLRTIMIYPAHHKYFSSRSQSICCGRKFYPASNCPSVTYCLGYPPKGSVRLLLCAFSILRAVNSIGQYSLM